MNTNFMPTSKDTIGKKSLSEQMVSDIYRKLFGDKKADDREMELFNQELEKVSKMNERERFGYLYGDAVKYNDVKF